MWFRLSPNLSNKATNETSVLNKYNAQPTSHAVLLYKLKTLTNLHVRPFITTFNPSLPLFSNIIKRHYNLLLCKQVFPHLYLLWLSDALLTSMIYLLQLNFLLTRLIPTHNSVSALSVAEKIAPPANDMQLIPIAKVHSKRDSVRKAREAFLISKG